MATNRRKPKEPKCWLPGSVQVGVLKFDVVRETMADCGDCNYAHSLIRVDDELSVDVTKVTIIHEIIHGILFAAGFTVSSGKHDEETIDAIAHGWLGVMRDNPELVRVLAEE